LLKLLTQLIAFAVSFAIVTAVARWTMRSWGRVSIVLTATAVAGALWSVFTDFTFAYADPEWDRSAEAVIQRALLMAVISMILGYFVCGELEKSSN
jgi:O-antigen/teichoic acid export membrane protein